MFSCLKMNIDIGGDENAFEISPKMFYIDSRETKTLECVFRPKAFSNLYFSELEAIVHYGSVGSGSNPNLTALEISPQSDFIVPMNVSITVAGIINYNILYIYHRRTYNRQCEAIYALHIVQCIGTSYCSIRIQY